MVVQPFSINHEPVRQHPQFSRHAAWKGDSPNRGSGTNGPGPSRVYPRGRPVPAALQDSYGRNITAMAPHCVAVLALPFVIPIDLAIPTQIFNERSYTPYELLVCSGHRGSVTTSTGFTIGSTAGLSALGRADTIIVPGYWEYQRPPAPEVTAALNVAFNRGARIASICTGAFALAAAGLLSGRTVTTHWSSADELERLYPEVRVDRSVLYIDDDPLLTSAGMTAGIDLCLYIVRKDLGTAVANSIARELVAAPHRDGAQAQYIDRTLPSPPTTPSPTPATGPWGASTKPSRWTSLPSTRASLHAP